MAGAAPRPLQLIARSTSGLNQCSLAAQETPRLLPTRAVKKFWAALAKCALVFSAVPGLDASVIRPRVDPNVSDRARAYVSRCPARGTGIL
jgi:hypothetical protein